LRVVVFGASGRVGKAFCEYAAPWYEVIPIMRPETDVLNEGDVATAVAGADAVCVALGVRGFADSSGSFVDAIKCIVQKSVEAGVSRIVTVALSGILPVDDPTVGGNGLRMDQEDYPQVFLDSSRQHLEAYEAIRDSGLDYTVICPPHMPHGERTGIYRVADESRPDETTKISVEDVADLMLASLDSTAHNMKRVGVSY